MFNISQENLQEALQQLELALYAHEQWLAALTRSIICRLPYDQHDVADDAHRHCRFGQWCYDMPPRELRNHPAFVAMLVEHQRMHQLAAQLLLRTNQEESVPAKDYDNFRNALDRLRLEIDALKHEIEELQHNYDSLTGAKNRKRMLTKLRELHELAQRTHPCGLAIIDLDNFKQINDRFGHIIGDHVLATAVRYITKRTRPYDSVFRYGGDEFLISLPNADLQTTQVVIGRIRAELAALKFATDESTEISLTASFGITQIAPDVSVEESVNRADIALYEAKTSGQNCCRVWNSSMSKKHSDQDQESERHAADLRQISVPNLR